MVVWKRAFYIMEIWKGVLAFGKGKNSTLWWDLRTMFVGYLKLDFKHRDCSHFTFGRKPVKRIPLDVSH